MLRRAMMAGGGDTITFIAASGTTYTIGTSQNQTIPVGANIGDLLLAFVMHRDTLTPAIGWDLVRTEGVLNSASGYTHSLSVYKRFCQSGDPGSSTSWAQATSHRMAVHIQAYHGNTGTPDVIANNGAARTVGNYANTTVSATNNNQIGIVAMSWVGASSGAISMTGYTLTTPSSTSENRLGVAYRSRNNAETTGGTWTVTPGGTNGEYHAQVSLMLGV